MRELANKNVYGKQDFNPKYRRQLKAEEKYHNEKGKMERDIIILSNAINNINIVYGKDF